MTNVADSYTDAKVDNIHTDVHSFFFSGFDRLPPGANPLDPHLIEMQRRYAASVGPGGLPPGHIPGVYPPASLASDLLARERERIERLGKWQPHCCYLR